VGKKIENRRETTRRRLQVESMEARLCLAASLGWDGVGQGAAELTYYIGNTPSNVDANVFEAAVETALEVWSDVADIEFTQTSVPNQRDSLDFSFTGLDGRGGTLAQAYFPDDVNPSRIAGDIQFDTSESWEVGNQSRSAFDLVLVAVHEIGHALGLQHSHASDSVLKDSVSANQRFEKLGASDVDAILGLYAATPTNAESSLVASSATPNVAVTIVSVPRLTPPIVGPTAYGGNDGPSVTRTSVDPGADNQNTNNSDRRNKADEVPETRKEQTPSRRLPWWQQSINRFRKLNRFVKNFSHDRFERPIVVRFSFGGNFWRL
jgi:hypothetical protein